MKIYLYKILFLIYCTMSYPTLDDIVLETLSFYRKIPHIPNIEISNLKVPLVVGSGNGYYTGRILFRNHGAYFA